MKNVPSKYHNAIKTNAVLENCLKKAKERFPGQELSFCGHEEDWESCFSSCLPSLDGTELSLLFYFNVGKATHAIFETVPL